MCRQATFCLAESWYITSSLTTYQLTNHYLSISSPFIYPRTRIVLLMFIPVPVSSCIRYIFFSQNRIASWIGKKAWGNSVSMDHLQNGTFHWFRNISNSFSFSCKFYNEIVVKCLMACCDFMKCKPFDVDWLILSYRTEPNRKKSGFVQLQQSVQPLYLLFRPLK